MKTIIAGSRSISSIKLVAEAIKLSKFKITEVVSGTAQGVDRLGEQYAEAKDIPVIRFPADWEKHGKSAGYKRNAAMAKYADALIAVWDGESRGTMHMINLAKKEKIKVYVHNIGV
jgi:hypothetical protein